MSSILSNRICTAFTLLTILFFASCSGNDEPSDFDCSTSDLLLVSQNVSQPTTCVGDGSITVLASGGKEPYKYALNTGAFGTTGTFVTLAAGDYVLRVKDKNGCESTVEVSLQLPGSDPLIAEATQTPDMECFTNNGSIEVTASGGQAPYQYKLGTGAFGSASTFSTLAPGNYSISVKDALDCIFVKSITVTKGDSGTSLANDIKPIIDENCATSNCHGGSESPKLTTIKSIRDNASKIKSLTQSGQMPREGSLTAEEKALIACWVDEGAKDN